MSGSKPHPILLLGALLFVCTAIGLGLIIPTSNAQDDPTPTPTEPGVITLIAGDYSIDITRIWETDEADGSDPDNDTYLILELVLHNDSSDDACFYRGDFRADFDGNETNPSDMDHVRDRHYDGWDYPGPFSGQCVDEDERVDSFVSYDVDLPLSEFHLEFTPQREQSSVIIWLEPLPDGEFSFGIKYPEHGESILSTVTSSPSPTTTPMPTQGPEADLIERLSTADGVIKINSAGVIRPDGGGTQILVFMDVEPGYNNEDMAFVIWARCLEFAFETYDVLPAPVDITMVFNDGSPIATGWQYDEDIQDWVTTDVPLPPTPTPTMSSSGARSTSQERFINSLAGNVNIRSGPSTNTRIVGTLSSGDSISVIGQSTDGDWYRIEFEGEEAWVFADLTSAAPPSTSSGGGGGTNATSPPAAVCSCAANTLNCGDFNTHAAAQACFDYCVSQGSGDIHALDRDNDNLACESLP